MLSGTVEWVEYRVVLPMPPGQLDRWLMIPIGGCGREADYSMLFVAFVCEECFQASGDAEE